MKKLIKSDQGFTLVELMVVVAIIGILSAVAIPNFKRYQAKTKTSEAKLQLSAIYQAETSLQSDYDAYATCLEDAGYAGPGSNNFYAVGFGTGNNTANGLVRGNGGVCANGNTFQWGGNKTVDGATSVVGDLNATATVPDNGASFLAEAAGHIANETDIDRWSINQDKTLTHVNQGY